jgi:hypothetical protein
MSQSPTGSVSRTASPVFSHFLRRQKFSKFRDWQEYCIESIINAHRAGVPQASIDKAISAVDADPDSANQFRYAENFYQDRYRHGLSQQRRLEDETTQEVQRRRGLEEQHMKQVEELSSDDGTPPAVPSPSPPKSQSEVIPIPSATAGTTSELVTCSLSPEFREHLDRLDAEVRY